ncbi:MAG: hypothetical protein ABSE93_06090 [Terriglobia bacterium]
MNRRKRPVLWTSLLVGVCACGISWCGQGETSAWVPFVAQRVIRTYSLSTSGRGEIQSETRAFTARGNDGSVFIYDAANYDPSSRGHHVGILEDAVTGKTFRIDYDHERVRVRGTPDPDELLPRRPPTAEVNKPASPELDLGSKMISGVRCIGWKVVAAGPNNPGGEMWVAPSLNYSMVESIILDYSNNVQIEVHLEDIQGGREPDPEPFRIPEGFQTLDADRVE